MQSKRGSKVVETVSAENIAQANINVDEMTLKSIVTTNGILIPDESQKQSVDDVIEAPISAPGKKKTAVLNRGGLNLFKMAVTKINKQGSTVYLR